MFMTINSQWASDMAKMVTDLPSTLVWSGQTVSVTASTVTRTDDVSPEGVFNVREVEVAAALSSFTSSTPPDVRAVVQLDGVKYHVTERESDGVCVRMLLRRV